MKLINKNIQNSPNWLSQYRRSHNRTLAQPYPIFTRNPPQGDGFDQPINDSLPIALANEQYNICCYCMCKINEYYEDPQKHGCDINPEHFIPQRRYVVNSDGEKLGYINDSLFEEKTHNKEATNYNNLLATCKNNKDCSILKGNFPFAANPLDHRCESIVKIIENGDYEINDSDWERDIITTLKLNERYKTQRKAVIDRAKMRLQLKQTESQKRFLEIIREEIEYWKTPKNNRLEPFCMAAIHYLQSKLI